MKQTRVLELHGTKVTVEDPGFGVLGRCALRVVTRLPAWVREGIFFSSRPVSFRFQKALQRLLGGPQLTSMTFTGGTLKNCRFECWTSEKYFLMGATYETEALEQLRGVIEAGTVVYDIGAHAGYWALMLGRLCAPGGRVVAFEPSPSNFARLQRNVTAAQSEAITPVNVAVADRDGTALLEERGSLSRMLDKASASGTHSRISTVRLDTYVYGQGGPAPSFVKIDIEGAAGACLEGMRDVLARAKPRMLIEIHDDHEAKAVAAVLSDYEYQVESIEKTDRFPWHLQAIPRSLRETPS